MFEGIFTAVVTPFKDGKIDENALTRLIERQISAGISGIVPVGTTGESATLTYEEHYRVIEIAVSVVNGRIPVIAGVGSNSTAETCCNMQVAKRLGANGALVITPYYNKPPQEGLYQHYAIVAQSADLPVILYNVLGRTGVNIEPVTIARLATECPSIVGIKEANGDMKRVSEIIRSCSDDFVILSGDDSSNLPIYALGGRGAISVASNVAPDHVVRLWHAWRDGDIAQAQKIHYDLWPLNQILFVETNPIPVKAALAMMGLTRGDCRLPLSQIGAENRKKIENVLRSMDLL